MTIAKIGSLESSLPCFAKLSAEEIEALKLKKKQVEYLKGETIFKQGAFAPYVLFVIDGLANVYLQTSNNKQLNIRIAGSGSFLAFTTLFGDDEYSFSAKALTNCVVCMIEKEALKELMIGNPEFALRITSNNWQTENRYVDIIHNLSYKQMRGKLASALMYLSSADFLKHDVFAYVSRQDIADFASITVESAIKFIKEFEKEKILLLDGKKIVITDPARLSTISKNG